jgi:hypothetical protein
MNDNYNRTPSVLLNDGNLVLIDCSNNSSGREAFLQVIPPHGSLEPADLVPLYVCQIVISVHPSTVYFLLNSPGKTTKDSGL